MSDGLKQEVDKLKRQVRSLEDELTGLSQIKKFLKKPDRQMHDILWECEKCGSRLGVYDIENNQLRVRYRDFFAYWSPGVGGYVQMVCRSCSHINRLNNQDNER